MENKILTTAEFNEQLFEDLCKDDGDEDNICLISGNPLEENSITLACSHTFNYDPIFEVAKRQKNFSKLETCKLKKYQLKCPYCRTVQNGILPYRENYNKLDGINWPAIRVGKNKKCSAIIKSGKRKGEKCGKSCCSLYCNRHNKKTTSKSEITCIAILASGKRKGLICGCKCIVPETIAHKLCKRHSKHIQSI